MLFNKFKSLWDNTVAEVWTLRIVIISLTAIILFLLGVIVVQKTDTRTIIVPIGMQKKFWVAGNYVSKSYLTQMGDYLSSDIMTFSPSSFKTSLGIFLHFVPPARYHIMQETLLNQIEKVTELNISQVFYPQRITVKGNRIIVNGNLSEFGGTSKKDVTNVSKTITIYFKIINGRFYVENINVK